MKPGIPLRERNFISARFEEARPAGEFTVTVWAPKSPVGAVVEICPSLFTVKPAGTLPNVTDVAPEKPAPVMLTGVPPLPELGLRLEMVVLG